MYVNEPFVGQLTNVQLTTMGLCATRIDTAKCKKAYLAKCSSGCTYARMHFYNEICTYNYIYICMYVYVFVQLFLIRWYDIVQLFAH